MENIYKINSMFKECVSLLSISENFSQFDTKDVEDLSYLFYECKKLEKLPDISKWNTENVICF